jgi:Zinc dependent phospholipase C
MRIQKHINIIWWCLPFTVYSVDANAWGLYTHVYFAQSLLFATPLLDKRFREAIKQFPDLVMAGACLPDLAIISKKFKTTHQWQKAEYLINTANSHEETAIAIGYASHLYVDVIAHNHFVPAHEALWQNESIFTHIASEWAMDVHIQESLHNTPGQLLSKHASFISHFIAPCFEQPHRLIKNKLITLAYADRLLRSIKLPNIIHKCICLNNNKKHKHFDYYIGKTELALHNFHKTLNGRHPNWQPELSATDDLIRVTMWRQHCLETLHIDHAEPIRYYST